MNYKQNLHIHSTYCDGKDSLEEIAQTAIEKGFDSIGFSGHSYMSFSKSGASMTPEKTEQYKQQIAEMKKAYAGKLDIFCGLEVELCSGVDLTGFDYLIGSAHYFPNGGNPIGFDRTKECVENVIREHFGGDGMKYAKAYYELLATMPEYGNFDIIGHFDLITKHSEVVQFFDEDSAEYRRYAVEAAEALVGKIPFFEVNTGAIARGYRTTPYPTVYLLKELKRLGFGAVITSDCHDRRFLDCYYEEARQMLLECGFRERYYLTQNGFVAVPV